MEFLEIIKQNSVYIFCIAIVGLIASFTPSIKLIKEVATFFKKKKATSVDIDRTYLKIAINGRFNFCYLECRIWNKIVPYNSDGCTFQNCDNELVKYTVSAGGAPNYEYDTIELEVANFIGWHKKSYKSFALKKSQRTGINIIDFADGQMLSRGTTDAYRVVYCFKENGITMQACEVFTFYNGNRYRFYFQSPRRLFASYNLFMNHLLSEFYVVDTQSYSSNQVVM
jgi:hypothetical protein